MDLATAWIVGGSVGLATTFGALVAARRALRSKADARALADNVARERDLARSLHPVIDPDLCIGSLACLKSCPEGDILGIVNGAARLVHGDHCIGHGQCAAECPVGAIQLVFGSARRGVDLPEVDEFFESSRPGVHVIGELGGMGLIRNAMVQGVQCVEHLSESLARPAPRTAAPALDLVIVGSGPAGLAAALTARKAGLSCRILEQGTMGGTVAQFPRHKIAMTEPVELPLAGRFGKRRMSKDELLTAFRRLVAVGRLEIQEGTKVVGIHGEDGAFLVETERGTTIAARKVLLAIGRRGTPRRLGVPGEEREKVTYSLTDAEQYRGAEVLVVGGGDAALESAIQLVDPGGARVTLSHRGEALTRCREANRTRIEALARAGQLRLLLSSTVEEIGDVHVDIATGDRTERIRNDFVVVNIGGELPLEMLKMAGVSIRRYHGEAPGAHRPPRDARARQLRSGLAREQAQRRHDRRLALLFSLLGAAVLGFLAWKGRDYYLLGPRARMASPLHRTLRSAGPWGHGVGIGATLFMLSNFLYAARKHLRFMSGWGQTRSWLHFHVFVGFMSPLVIAFHAAFQSRNLLATGTASALAVVVLTGIIGRYVYGLVPAAGEQVLEVEELQGRFVRLSDELEPLLANAADPARVRRLLERVQRPVRGGSLVLALVTSPFRRLRLRADLRRVRRLFATRDAFLEFREAYLRLQRLTVQIRFYRSLKGLLGGWRLFHASLAVFLVLIMTAHIALSLYLGYGLLRW